MKRRDIIVVFSLILAVLTCSCAYATQIKAVAVGAGCTAVLKTDGTVWTIGGYYGTSLCSGSIPIRITSLDKVVAISGGYRHMVALKADGSVWSWGYNESGQLGNGTRKDSSVPVRVSGISEVVAVAAGDAYTLALKKDGTVWGWGYNLFGRLGDGTQEDRLTPVQTLGLKGITAISAGSHSVALTANGTLWAWGYNGWGELGDGTQTHRFIPTQVIGISSVASVAAGTNHTLALTRDGQVWSWGCNTQGQLGTGVVDKLPHSLPQPIHTLRRATVIAVGGNYMGQVSIAVNDGVVWAWGDNRYGQLGNGTVGNLHPDGIFLCNPLPQQVRDLAGVVSVATNGDYTVALDRGGSVWTWGVNNGQFGDGTAVARCIPAQVTGLTGVRTVAGGIDHTVTLKSDGTVWSWGANTYGQLGDGTKSSRSFPVKASGLSGVIAIAAGSAHTVALRYDGSVWIWGSVPYGWQNNPGPATTQVVPQPAYDLGGVVAISAGAEHVLALKKDGTVWTWGRNDRGQLGALPRPQVYLPMRVASLTGVVAISAGEYASAAVKSDGTVWVWGDTRYAQYPTIIPVPVQVMGLPPAVGVLTTGSRTFVKAADGSVWGWGYSQDCELGVLNTTYRPTPIRIDGFNGNLAMAAAAGHTLSIQRDASVWAWGAGNEGQTGPWTRVPRSPVILDAASVAAGYHHSVVVKRDGTVWTWGENFEGQLGDGLSRTNPLPTKVVGLNPMLIPQAKAEVAGARVAISNVVVTAVFPDCIYVEAPDRTWAIKVISVPYVGRNLGPVKVGMSLDIIGNVTTIAGEKTLSMLAYCITNPGVGIPVPVTLTNDALGGGDYAFNPLVGAGQEGVFGWQLVDRDHGSPKPQWLKSSGPNNIGLLVQITGRIVEVEKVGPRKVPSWFVVDDGSLNTAKVIVPQGVIIPRKNARVSVTGISACEGQPGSLTRLLKVRLQQDIAMN